jgi:hypothetical protein
MAISSFPFDSQTSSESDWSHLFRYLTTLPGGGIIGEPTGTALKVTGDSSGMNVKVAAGTAIVRGHMIISDAVTTVTISTASASNPRIDSIVLNLDPTANAISIVAVAGTPAASPVAPTLTQTDTAVYQLKLADVLVGQSVTSIAPASVTDTRPFAGTDLGVWVTANRPTGTTGLAGFNTSTGSLEVYNGTAWVSLALSGASINASQLSGSEQLNLNAGKVNGSKITVSSTAPSSPSTGDLWFW